MALQRALQLRFEDREIDVPSLGQRPVHNGQRLAKLAAYARLIRLDVLVETATLRY